MEKGIGKAASRFGAAKNRNPVAAEKDIGKIIKAMRKHVGAKPVVQYRSPFHVLISTVLSQRTKDANTEKASMQLFSRYKTAVALAQAQLGSIEKLIRPAGFYRVKAKNIRKICRQLVQNFNGMVPRSKDMLLALPGVGPKTAACVMVYGFRQPDLPVDVHVHRISNRLGLVNTKTPEETERALKKIVPRKYWLEINHLMVRFGQKICLPRNPKHEECELRGICDFYKLRGKWKCAE